MKDTGKYLDDALAAIDRHWKTFVIGFLIGVGIGVVVL